LTVQVPPGVDTGSRVRVAGKGEPGQFNGPPGDLYLLVAVKPHPFLERKGKDLYLDVPITVGEAMRGATITVPRVGGKVNVKVPAKSQSGQMLRLKGQGVRSPKSPDRGDLFVRLLVHVPTNRAAGIDPAIDALEQTYDVSPRQHLRL
jgi:DnaJ-class molecular chaperone